VRFVVNYGLGNIDHGVPIARAAEAAGFASLGIPDSFFYPKHSDSRYPYTPDGGRSFIEHQAFLDPCVWIATMAAVTKRLRFYPWCTSCRRDTRWRWPRCSARSRMSPETVSLWAWA